MYELQVVDFVLGTETCLYKTHMYTVTNGGDYWNENVSVWLEWISEEDVTQHNTQLKQSTCRPPASRHMICFTLLGLQRYALENSLSLVSELTF